MRNNSPVLEPNSSNTPHVFKVGDMVQFRFVSSDVQGHIIEDRGGIAKGGQHLYRVLVDTNGVSREIEMPAEELRAVTAP